MRRWSVEHARTLERLYAVLESVLGLLQPVLKAIGYERLERPFLAVERLTKGILLDSKSCGQCIVGFTGLACPMNCPKQMRNGPCGGVRADGTCEVDPGMTCVWLLAWDGSKRLGGDEYSVQILQPAIDHRLLGHSAWLREVRRQSAAAPASRTATFDDG